MSSLSLLMGLIVGCGEKDLPDDTQDSDSAVDDTDSPTDDSTGSDSVVDDCPYYSYQDVLDVFDRDGDGYLDVNIDQCVLDKIVAGVTSDDTGVETIEDFPEDIANQIVAGTYEFDQNDDDPTIYPGAPELCDTKDNNQNGEVDENPGEENGTAYSPDNDGDTFGNNEDVVYACEAPDESYVTNASDCDDNDANVNPDAEEVCEDGVDNNCDGEAPECHRTGEIDLADAEMAFRSSVANGLFGSAVTDLGDLDNDGDTEFAMARIGASGSSFDIFVFDGDPDLEFTEYTILTATAPGVQEAEDFAMTNAGDVDGDGVDDIWLMPVFKSLGKNGLLLAEGAVYFVSGADLVDDDGDTGAVEISVFEIDDIDQIEIPYELQSRVDVGSYNMEVTSLHEFDEPGVVFSLTGDQADSSVYLLSDPLANSSWSLTDADFMISESDDGEQVGGQLSVGDLDGDGHFDLTITSIGHDEGTDSDVGRVGVFLNPEDGSVLSEDADVTLLGANQNDFMGTSLVTNGDINGDGYYDLTTSAVGVNDQRGAVYIFYGGLNFSGPLNVSDADIAIAGNEEFGTNVGSSVAVAPLDAGLQDDVAIGVSARQVDINSSYIGGVFVLYNLQDGTYLLESDADFIGRGEDTDDLPGRLVTAVTNPTGTGNSSLLVSATRQSYRAEYAGAVYLLSFDTGF